MFTSFMSRSRRESARRSLLLARVTLAVALALMTAVPLLPSGGAALAKPDRTDPAHAALCAGENAHGKQQITALTITIDRLEPVAEEATASDAAIQEPAVAQDACAMLEAALADTLAEGTVDPATACIVTGRADRVVSTSPGCARPADPDKRRNVPCLASSAAAIAGPAAAAGSNITATASCAGLPAASFAMVPFGGGGGAMAVGPVVNIFPWGCVIAVVLAAAPGIIWAGVCA